MVSFEFSRMRSVPVILCVHAFEAWVKMKFILDTISYQDDLPCELHRSKLKNT